MKRAVLKYAFWVLLAAAAVLAAPAQVVRLAGGVSSIDNGRGATAVVYQGDSTTQVGIGYADGIRIGASREVRVGNASLTAGDTSIALKLPTDLQDAPRIFRARGVLLQSAGPQSNTQLLAGVTGLSYGNAYMSSVQATNTIAVFTTTRRFDKVELSALQIKGVRNSSLVSAAFHASQSNFFALTTGVSAGSHILRVAAHHGNSNDHLDASYTTGQLRLQPEATLGDANLERVGWNISAARHVTKWLLLDGGRHEYATADASANPIWSGVTASRSDMVEFGASLRLPGGLQASTRIFHSASGPQHTHGEALLVGWHSRLWDTHFTSVRSGTYMDALPSLPGSGQEMNTRANLLDASQRVLPRLLLRESVNISAGSRSVDFGGAYDGNRVNLSVGHREVFVPFGSRTGFHSLMVISVRIRLRDSQVGVDTVRGGGLPAMYGVTAEGYYGELDGERLASSRAPALPKFAVHGTVVNQAKQPLRGAAVAVGRQTVYTDSEGRFLARVEKNTPVVVALKPAEFLTAERYAPVSLPLTVAPERAAEARPVELQAAVSLAPPQEAVSSQTYQDDSTVHRSRLARTLNLLKMLGHRMLHLPLHRSTANTQVQL